jgi:hypothetical protein
MANRGLGSLTLDLIAKIGGWTAPLTQAERKLDATARAMEKRSREIAARGAAIEQGFAKIGIAIGTAAVGITAFLAKGTKSAIDFADQLNDMNVRLGISAEALTGWGYAARQTGTDIDALGKGFKTLTKNLTEASVDATSEQAKLFDALGVSRDSLNDIEKALPQIAEGFKNLDNEVLEATLAQKLFGKSGIDLLEFLNQGEAGLEAMRQRARELGIELGQDTLTAADQFNDTLGDLKAVTEGFFLQIAQDLLPKLIELSQSLVELSKDGNTVKEAAQQVGNAFEFVAEWTGRAYNQLDGLGKIIEGLTEGFVQLWAAAKAFATLDFTGAAGAFRNSSAGSLIKQGGIQLVTGTRARGAAGASSGMDFSLGAPLSPEERARMEARVNRAIGPTSKDKKAKTGKSDEEKEAERLQKAYESLNQSLTERVALFGQEGEAAKVRYEIEFGELHKLTQAQKDELIQRAEKLDMMNAEKELQEKLNALDERRVEATKDILADNAFELEMLGKTIEQQEILNKLRYAGATANDAYGQSIIESTEALQQQREATENQIELMDEFRSGAVSALTDIVTGAKSAKDAFKDFFDDLARRITQMIAEKWIEQAFGQMGTTSTGSGGGWVAAIASLFGGGRAAGGAVNQGMFYRVNENQPELLSIGGRDFLMMGNQSGVVSPRGIGVSGPSITNINVQGTVSRETIKQIDRANGSRAAREMTRTGRR